MKLFYCFCVGIFLSVVIIFFQLRAGNNSVTGPLADLEIQYDPLPQAKQGRFPIHIPAYDQIDQFLLLSNRWVIVAFSNVKEVGQKINDLSSGEYLMAAEIWSQSVKDQKPAWNSLDVKENLYLQHGAKARELSGELLLDNVSYYRISSATDENYRKTEKPLRVTRYLASLGKNREPIEYEIYYAHYCYLEMPYPLQQGHVYTISLENGKSTTFLYNELSTVSRAIKVNQGGYLPDSKHKYAYLGCYLQEFGPMDCSHVKEFSVISVATGKTVLHGEPKLRSKNPRIPARPDTNDNPEEKSLLTGEDTYEMDLALLKEEGEFFISIPGIGRSWAFRHASDVYGELFYVATRGLYHQRCGIAIGKPYTAWPRLRCHTEPIYESKDIKTMPPFESPKYNPFDVILATLDTSKKTENALGGWHDAGDWDRNILHFIDIFDLLSAYELFPNKFSDNQLNIPESGNGIPDILDEAYYGLKIWRASMDARHGVSGEAETWGYPDLIDPRFKFAFSQRTRWSSLLYAAAAAQLAQLIRPFDEKFAQECLETALQAYTFGIDPKNSLGKVEIHAVHDKKPFTAIWEEEDVNLVPFLIQANLRLFILTEDHKYLSELLGLLSSVKMHRNDLPFSDLSPWIYLGLFSEKVSKHIPLIIKNALEKSFFDKADQLLSLSAQEPYRQSWPPYQDYWMDWGNTTMTNQARILLMAYHFTQEEKYRDGAILNTDYMYGTNPMGMCWTTGVGFTYPIEIQHTVSELDGIMDPVPGITIYGPTSSIYYKMREMVWDTPRPGSKPEKFLGEKNRDVPLFRRWSCHPYLDTRQCEFTVYQTISPNIFVSAMLMPYGWMPSEQLKNRNPREDYLLFGYWYLP